MTGSFIHAAFDPQPYIVLSACSVAIGITLEMGLTRDKLRRFIGSIRRHAAKRALHGANPSRLHPLTSGKY